MILSPPARQAANADSSDEVRGPDALVGEAAQALILTHTHRRMRVPIPRMKPGVRPHRLTANRAALTLAFDAIPHRPGCDGTVPRRVVFEQVANGARSSSATKLLPSAAECLKVSRARPASPATGDSAAAPNQRPRTKLLTISGATRELL